MASRVEALIDKLAQNHPKGFDLSLGRITRLLEKLGNPQKHIPLAIHVAGTNGKGSTLAFARAILEASGYRVHVHTSPHLVTWTERYRLAGKLVSDDVLADAIERASDANDGEKITIFEIMSAVMFMLFSEHEADFSLVEVGLGGRADATNMIENPLVCAITPIALDHQAYLGDTIGKIAFEKAGIIKPGRPVVTGLQEDEARKVIEQVAAQSGSPIMIARQDFDFYRDATGFVYQDEDGLLDLPLPRLVGEFQLENAATAIAAIRVANIMVEENAWKEGMRNASWPGRLEKLPAGKITKSLASADVWIDGGHNPSGGEVIATELSNRLGNRPLVMICGMINTKDPVGYFSAFAGLDPTVLTVPIENSEAGIDPEELARNAAAAGLKATAHFHLDEAVGETAKMLALEPDATILFSGSLYFVGEILDRNGTPPQ